MYVGTKYVFEYNLILIVKGYDQRQDLCRHNFSEIRCKL